MPGAWWAGSAHHPHGAAGLGNSGTHWLGTIFWAWVVASKDEVVNAGVGTSVRTAAVVKRYQDSLILGDVSERGIPSTVVEEVEMRWRTGEVGAAPGMMV